MSCTVIHCTLLQMLDNVFVAVNNNSVHNVSFNSRNIMVRHEFLEMLVRLAIAAFGVNPAATKPPPARVVRRRSSRRVMQTAALQDANSTMPARCPSEAVEKLLVEHVQCHASKLDVARYELACVCVSSVVWRSLGAIAGSPQADGTGAWCSTRSSTRSFVANSHSCGVFSSGTLVSTSSALLSCYCT